MIKCEMYCKQHKKHFFLLKVTNYFQEPVGEKNLLILTKYLTLAKLDGDRNIIFSYFLNYMNSHAKIQ